MIHGRGRPVEVLERRVQVVTLLLLLFCLFALPGLLTNKRGKAGERQQNNINWGETQLQLRDTSICSPE